MILPMLRNICTGTSDATGSYYRYAFSYGTSQFNDYPKMGVWPDGYYTTFNIFNNGHTFAGAKLCFQLGTSYGGVLPSDLDGTTAPPTGSPNFMINVGSNALNLWKFHVDWTNSASSTLSGPTSIPVAAFSTACGGGTCIPQPGTNNKLDSLADRLMYRLAYRNIGGHEALVVNHSVKVSGTKTSQVDGIRWYELRSPNATPVVYQQGTYSPISLHSTLSEGTRPVPSSVHTSPARGTGDASHNRDRLVTCSHCTRSWVCQRQPSGISLQAGDGPSPEPISLKPHA